MLTVVSTHMKWRFFKYIRENRLAVLFFMLFSIGMIFGSVTISRNENLSVSFSWYLSLCDSTFLKILVYSLMISFAPLMVSYFCGLFMYGYIPCAFLFLFHGLGYGAISGYLYSVYGLKGVAFVLLVLLPSSFLNCALQLIACREAFRFSVLLCKNYYKNTIVSNPFNHIKRYHFKYGILMVIAFLVALLDSLLSFIFIGVFGF